MAKKTHQEKQLESRMRAAVDVLSADPKLRFFLRTLIELTGADSTPDGHNALDQSRAIGRHSVGMDIIAILNRYNPVLYATLLREYAEERQTPVQQTYEVKEDYSPNDDSYG